MLLIHKTAALKIEKISHKERRISITNHLQIVMKNATSLIVIYTPDLIHFVFSFGNIGDPQFPTAYHHTLKIFEQLI